MSKWAVIFGILAAFPVVGCANSSRFDEHFQPIWALDHFTYEGELVKMKLDSYSGNKRRNIKRKAKIMLCFSIHFCVCVCVLKHIDIKVSYFVWWWLLAWPCFVSIESLLAFISLLYLQFLALMKLSCLLSMCVCVCVYLIYCFLGTRRSWIFIKEKVYVWESHYSD